MITTETALRISVSEATLFAFDDHAIPWRDNLSVTLCQAQKHPANPVLRCSPQGAPDSTHALIYGSVHHIDGKFRMWYLGMFEETWDPQTTGWWRPMCYAESDDGIHWAKPDLGLVELNGSRHNNICLIEPQGSPLARVNDFLSVIHEAEDPDPAQRYKAAFIAHVPWTEVQGGVRDVGEAESRLCAMVCATSADGLTWRVVGDRPRVDEKFEVAGLYRFGNFYYATGQQNSPWVWRADGSDCGRVMATYRSPDFVNWSPAKALGFARPGQLAEPAVPGQQTHMGAGIWNRGNVLVGLYGMWQDGPADRPEGASHLYGTRVDLGLVTSHDGIHWREPVPGFKVIPRSEEGEWDAIALTQAHAFANVGEETYLWYGHWDCEWQGRPQAIGLASLRRDGFGHLSLHRPSMPGRLVTCLVQPGDRPVSLSVNVAGVHRQRPLQLELLDDRDQPISGYSADDAATVNDQGARQEVRWPRTGRPALDLDQPFAVRATFPERGNVQLYALYLSEVGGD